VSALIAANMVCVVLFGALYGVAGARWIPQPAFLACLAMLLALTTTLWVRAEAVQGRGRDALSRFGRIAFALLVVLIATPSVALLPVFWLDTQLPADAGFRPLLGPIMALVLIALALTVAVNVIGGVVVAVRGLSRPTRGDRAAGR
jgi:hypothetical protein